MRKSIAVIGLGAMGGAMAGTLHRAGWRVSGYDPVAEARGHAEAAGVRTVESLESLAAVTYAVLSLPNAGAVRETIPRLLAIPGLHGIVDTTTSEPSTSRDMALVTREQGIGFIDAPVSGGRLGASTGRLSAFVGGSEQAVETCRPVLEALTGGQYQHLGGPGAGNVVKLINNALAAANLATVGEALAIARAWGIDPAAAASGVSAASGGSRASSVMYPDWVLSGSYDSGFTMELMARDVALAIDVAAEVGESPRLLAATNALWQASLADLGPASDFTEIARTVAPELAVDVSTNQEDKA
ncbi:MAG: NAD(P)-dependent oxidoreductase [Micropruina sp.]